MKINFLWNINNMWKFTDIVRIFGRVPNVWAKQWPWDPEQLLWIERHPSPRSVLSWHQTPPCNPLQKYYATSLAFPPLPPPVSLKENSEVHTANKVEHNTNSINKQTEIHVASNNFHKIQHSMTVRLKVLFHWMLQLLQNTPAQALSCLYAAWLSQNTGFTLKIKKK